MIMHPRITSKRKLLALDWPDEVPVLIGEDIDGYMESLGRGRKSVRDWLEQTFDRHVENGKLIQDQFAYVLMDVMLKHCDRRDRQIICFGSVPSTTNYQPTAAPYSPDEVAEWWNEALQEVGYDV